jgi:hypothetical protein
VQVLDCLHAEIADFEQKTGRRSATAPQNSETFSGYTVSLVTAVTKLTHYIKEVTTSSLKENYPWSTNLSFIF